MQTVTGVVAEDHRKEREKRPTWLKFLICIGSPFILLYQSLRLFVAPCICAYLATCLCKACCFCFGCCRKCCHHTDDDFPATEHSLGSWNETGPGQSKGDITWRTADEICEGKTNLFTGIIEPSDIAQGRLGDCWLLTSLAALAEFPGAIQKNFITKSYSYIGKYKVKLYDVVDGKWVTVSVDDRFPCDKSGQPIFSRPKDNELWVLVLEKAFAKFCGDYGALQGGQALWAFEALTGDFVFRWMTEKDGVWKRFDLVHFKDDKNKRAVGVRESTDAADSNKMYDILKKYDKKRAILAASSVGNDDSKKENGIVQGHAYTINKVKEIDGFKLLRIRNPWGTFEWSGDWGDKSPLWEKHSSVRSACKMEDKDDGMFWISWEDFQRYFKSIDICSRTTGFDDLGINMNEGTGWGGPCKGCCKGCFDFWCCCQGCMELCCHVETSRETVKV